MDAMLPPQTQTNDAEHLRLLSIFHYVMGGLTALFAFFPLIHVAIGTAFIMAPETVKNNQMPRAEIGWFLVGVAIFMMLLGWTSAILIILTGRYLGKCRNYTFCLVIACLECLFVPLGTVLGIFTLLVLNRPSVRALFGPQYP